MSAPTNEEKILENALAPKRVTGDTGSAEQHPIADQIAAAQYAAAQTNARRRGFPIKICKIVPPGACD